MLLYKPVCVRPGRNPKLLVLSCSGSCDSFTGTESVCYPVHRTTYGSYFLDKGDYTFDLESVEIFDIGPIHSTDIFKVPKQCMGTHVKETKSKMATRFLI